MSAEDVLVAALLKGDVVRQVWAVYFDFQDAPTAVWPGFGPVDASAFGGPVFLGTGLLGQIGPVETGAAAAVESLTLELSGLDATLFAIAQDQAERVKGRRCTLWRLVFDESWSLVSAKKKRTFDLDKMKTAISGDGNPPSMVLRQICESTLAAKNRSPWAFLTDADQRAIYPTDRALERATELTGRQTLIWG